MQTDITLTLGERTLIIDTKYYSHTLQEHFDKKILHAGNMFQIYTYVANEDVNHAGRVDGMLLYARTSSFEQPDERFCNRDGNIFMVKTLDLNQDFSKIEEQLKNLIEYYKV